MNDSIAYSLANVRKEYDQSFRLSIQRLEVGGGRVLGLLGPTGAGKSTLLRLLAGSEPPSSGELQFEGSRLPRGAWPLATRRRITLVHQRPVLLSGSVRYNVEYGLRIRRASSERPPVDDVLRQLRLSQMAGKSSRTLSGGQTQLVALARALVIEPDVLLLDEPTANLDPAHVALVEETIQTIQRQRKMTVVWATHNLFQARRVAEQIALLWDGTLVELADTETFFESPADPRTADFVQGKMVY